MCAFLFLGFTFLVFVVLRIIWIAGWEKHQTWILWSFGIVLGMAIVALFGVFEKRRNDVIAVIEKLKGWD